MDYVYGFVSNLKNFYLSVNQSVLSGAVDVIVVEQLDGSYASTSFHVCFGIHEVFNHDNKFVDIEVNKTAVNLKMKLNKNGVAYFVDSVISGKKSPTKSSLLVLSNKINKLFPIRKIKRRHSAGNELPKKNITSKYLRMVLKKKNFFRGSYSCTHIDKIKNTRMLPKLCSEWKWGTFPEFKKLKKVKLLSRKQNGLSKFSSHNNSSCNQLNKKKSVNSNSFTTSANDFNTSEDEMKCSITDRKRSMRLSSAQLQSLGLSYGSNEARFSITTKFQGTAWCSCHIYLLKWKDQLVVSDIDGTITKSDVLGHVIPTIGGTWAHAGVAELYTMIKANGYRLIYLSSRTIGMSHNTKNYLKSVTQGVKMLPDGPVLLSPYSIFMALRKEIVEGKPEEFKIDCLNDLKALFPTRQPFFVGFGNRKTDVKAYKTMGIPSKRIFIIDSSGVVNRPDGSSFTTTYSAMASHTVDFLFPPLFQSNFEKKANEKMFIKPEDMFYDSQTGSFSQRDSINRNGYFKKLVDEESIADYNKRRKILIAKKNRKT